MKKLKSLIAVAGATVLLTSCLDGGNNEQTGVAVGVIDLSTDIFRNVAYTTDYMSVFSPSFESLSSNDCIIFAYTINYDDPANNGSNKYLTATVSAYEKLEKGNAISVIDTTDASIKKGEMTTLGIDLRSSDPTGTGYGTIKNYLFMASSHPNSSTDQSNEYILQYDNNQIPQTVDGKRVYDLFLRVVKRNDGKNTVGNASFTYTFEAGRAIEYLKSREKSEGNEQLYLRFNYIKEFNKDTTSATWDKTQPLVFPILKEETTN